MNIRSIGAIMPLIAAMSSGIVTGAQANQTVLGNNQIKLDGTLTASSCKVNPVGDNSGNGPATLTFKGQNITGTPVTAGQILAQPQNLEIRLSDCKTAVATNVKTAFHFTKTSSTHPTFIKNERQGPTPTGMGFQILGANGAVSSDTAAAPVSKQINGASPGPYSADLIYTAQLISVTTGALPGGHATTNVTFIVSDS